MSTQGDTGITHPFLYRINLPGFKLFPYRAGEGNTEQTYPALWIVSHCFANNLHIDSLDKTNNVYMAWWQAHWDSSTQKWLVSNQDTDENMVQDGAFFINSLGVGIDLQK
jgi:hypothetical protein